MDHFKFEEKLGAGAYGTVYRAIDLTNNEARAIKIIPKGLITSTEVYDRIRRETKLYQELRHPYIVKGYEFVDFSDNIYIVMEFVSNGSLLAYINENGAMSEDDAKDKFMQLVLAIQYLHHNGITHRDIKPENILLDENNDIKLTDFGFAKIAANENQMMSTNCGTIAYISPEILNNQLYTNAVDIWSMGVLLYAMVLGYLPFRSNNAAKLSRLIIETQPKFPISLSPQIIDLLSGMMCKDPQLRLTVDEIIHTQWIHEFYVTKYEEKHISLSRNQKERGKISGLCDSLPKLGVGSFQLAKTNTDTFSNIRLNTIHVKRSTTLLQQVLKQNGAIVNPRIRLRAQHGNGPSRNVQFGPIILPKR